MSLRRLTLMAAVCLALCWGALNLAQEKRHVADPPAGTRAGLDNPAVATGEGRAGLRSGRPQPSPTQAPLPTILPVTAVASDETCDDADNDGDGEIDEDLTRPCASACDIGTETCAAGQWIVCSARPCCDVMIGPGLPQSTLCPAAEAADTTVCLMPGTYTVASGCQVHASLVGLGDPASIVIDDDVLIGSLEPPDRIQGVTITGGLDSDKPLHVLHSRVLGGVFMNGPGGEPAVTEFHEVSHSEIRSGMAFGFPMFAHANEITPSLGLGADYARRHVVTDNHIFGPGSAGLGATGTPGLSVYLARNRIEGVDVGVRIPCYIGGAQVVANSIDANAVGIDVCGQSGGLWLLRNEVSFGGESGVVLHGRNMHIEGNQIVRASGAASSPFSNGLSVVVLSDGPAGPFSVRDNTIAGDNAIGIRIDQDVQTTPVPTLSGNIVVTGTPATGVQICARDRCPADPLFGITAFNNDVVAGSALWSGTSDPTGVDGNISADPQFVDAAAGDFRLAEGSPCIDAGAPATLLVDLPGHPRILDGDGDGTAVPDMGAWEAGPPCRDEDGDGFGSPGDAVCEGGDAEDCDDSDPAVHPGAVDLPGNTINESCSGAPPACNPERAGGWRNHGQYVSCVARTVSNLVARGLISSDEGDLLVRAAARSNVGK